MTNAILYSRKSKNRPKLLRIILTGIVMGSISWLTKPSEKRTFSSWYKEVSFLINNVVLFLMLIDLISDYFSKKVSTPNPRISNKTNTTKMFSYKHFLPFERREEVLGDLYEIKEELIEHGYSKFNIWRKLSWLKITIFVWLKKDQLSAWLEKQLSIIK